MSRTKKTARSSLAVSPFGGDQLIPFLIGFVVGAVLMFVIIVVAAVMSEERDKW